MKGQHSKLKVAKIARTIYKPLSIKNIFNYVKFLKLARQYQAEINGFDARLAALNIPVTPEMLGTVEWPYIHNEWDVATRLNTIATHYELLSDTYPNLTTISSSPCMNICSLDDISKGVYVGIDYAKWFTREGEMVINIFRDDLRVATMAFSLASYQDDVVIYIGAVQGIHGGIPADESLEIYKILTKDFYGLRPRSLLLEILKVVANKLGAKQIFGVSEQNRHHRHEYFGNNQMTEFNNDYNSFWLEHGGAFVQDIGFYAIPTEPAMRDLSEIASKKRGQYRRRNEFIASLPNIVHLK